MKAERLLKKGLRHLNVPFNEDQIAAFLRYLEELKRWNRAYSLTGARTDDDIVIRHFLDSLLYLKVISKKVAVIADAGSGAGFPGIPIKIIRPEIELSLIESTRKKAAFLRHIVRALELKKTIVYQKRLEELGEEEAGRYDVVVSRATFKIEEFLKKACPYVKEAGYIVLSKGERVRDEINSAPHIRSSVKNIIRTPLPFVKTTRILVVLDCHGYHGPI